MIFPECTVEQKDAGCCESDAFGESSEGNIEWITKDNGAGGKWEPGSNYIEFKIANDKNCNGNATKRQTGTATIEFDSSESKTIVLNMEGRAEASYELFELFVDDVSKAKVQASGTSSDDKDGCKVGIINWFDTQDM